MPLRSTWMVLMLGWALCLAGCSTVSRQGAIHSASDSNPAASASGPRLESPEEVERRADAHARFLQGLSLEMNSEPEHAEEAYEKALELDPSNEPLALDLSRRLIGHKELDRAAAILKKAAAAPDVSALVLSRLGLVYLQLGKTNAAIESLQDAIKRQPKSISGYQSLYTLYRGNGQTNEARHVVEQADRQDKVDASFLVDLATLHFLEDTPKSNQTNVLISPRALTLLNRALAMSPTNGLVLQKLAQGFRLAGESKKASAVYMRLLKEYPNVPGLREELTELLLRSNDTKAAAEQLQALVRDNPTNPQAYFYLGAIAYEEGRYAEAVEHYRKALLLNPDHEQLYYDIAAAKIALNEPGEALDYLRQAQKRFKPTFVGEFFSAIAYMRLKDYTNAVLRFSSAEVIGTATDTNRLSHTFYFQYGSACERSGRIADAETLFEKSLKISPNFPEALNYLGYMWAERGTNLSRAREMIEQAIKLSPTNAAYLDSLGWVLFKQGHPREALPNVQKAVELNKEPDATLFDHLGDIYAALHQPEKAKEAWRKALNVEPNKDIEQKLNGEPKGGGKKRDE